MRTDAGENSFTGWHMAAIMAAFFGVIIAVNVAMASFASTSWTGIVVKNSYVASQQFNAKMAQTRAQAALGWKSALAVRDNVVRYDLSDSSGRAIPARSVKVTFKRPVDDRHDHDVSLSRDASAVFSSPHHLADGVWLAEVETDAGLDFPYRETLRLQIKGGTAK